MSKQRRYVATKTKLYYDVRATGYIVDRMTNVTKSLMRSYLNWLIIAEDLAKFYTTSLL